MKKSIIIIFVCFCSFLNAQELSDKDLDFVKKMYYYAKELYDMEGYEVALDNINNIEKKTGTPIPYTDVLNLKIKTLLALNKTSEAKKEINFMLKMDLNDDYISKIERYKEVIKQKEDQKKEKIDYVNNILSRSSNILNFTEEEITELNNKIKSKNVGYKVVSFMLVDEDKFPTFYGCEEVFDKKSCFNKKITNYVKEKTSLIENKKFKQEKIRFFTGFSIGKNGNVFNAKIKGGDAETKREIIKILYSLPIINGGQMDSEKIVVNFSIPLILN